MYGWQNSLILKCFLFLQLSSLGIAGCRYDIYPPQGPSLRCIDPSTRVASYIVEQHACTILSDLPYGFFYMVVPLTSEDKYCKSQCCFIDYSSFFIVAKAVVEQVKVGLGMLINVVRPYNPNPDDPCDFSSAAITDDFNSCFWWNMAQYRRTDFGMTCLNDTNVYDTAVPATMAKTLSFSATKTFSSTVATGEASSPVQESNGPIATDGPDKESIGLQKQANKIGLAVGLGVGVPALLLALVGLVYQIRSHRKHTQTKLSGEQSISVPLEMQRRQDPLVLLGSTPANSYNQAQSSSTPQKNGVSFHEQAPTTVYY